MTSNLNNKLILPNKSSAGLKLGATKKTLLKIWGDPIEIEKIASNTERLVYENAQFWLESNKITQIGIYNLYEGKTKDGIELGSTKEEVEEIHGSLSWDGTWHVNAPPFGIGFDFESNYVTEIFIFEEYY
jgi:hypothetical protein